MEGSGSSSWWQCWFCSKSISLGEEQLIARGPGWVFSSIFGCGPKKKKNLFHIHGDAPESSEMSLMNISCHIHCPFMTKDYPHSKSGKLFKGTISDRIHWAFLSKDVILGSLHNWSEENKRVPEKKKEVRLTTGQGEEGGREEGRAGRVCWWFMFYLYVRCVVPRCRSMISVTKMSQHLALQSHASWLRKGLVEARRGSGCYGTHDRIEQKVTAPSPLANMWTTNIKGHHVHHSVSCTRDV